MNNETQQVRDGSLARGKFYLEHYRDGKLISTSVAENIVVDEGLQEFLAVTLMAAPQNTAGFFIGMFKGNYTPVAGDNAANIAANSTESTEYASATRMAWTPNAAIQNNAISNSDNPAIFVANATVDWYGAFLISDATKGGTAGKLIAAAKFPVVRNMLDTDTLHVTYQITANSV